jgi:flagellar biogenesis protein FliO
LSAFLFAGLIAVVNRSRPDDRAQQADNPRVASSSPVQLPVGKTPEPAEPVRSALRDSLSPGSSSSDSVSAASFEGEALDTATVQRRYVAAQPDSIPTRRSQSRIAAGPIPREASRSLVGPILAVILLAFGTVIAVWLKRTRQSGTTNTAIQSIARLQLSQNQEVRLIRVRGEEILIGSTQSTLTVLHNFGSASGTGINECVPRVENHAESIDEHRNSNEPVKIHGAHSPVARRSESRVGLNDAISVDHPNASNSDEWRQTSLSFESHLRSTSAKYERDDSISSSLNSQQKAQVAKRAADVASDRDEKREVARG